MRRFWLLALLGGALSACFTGSVRQPDPAPDPGDIMDGFSHRPLDRVLGTYVDDEGLVNYAALAYYRRDLDHYAAQLARFSPDSHPHLFDDEADRLAYWLNAYNALVLRGVADSYPITSVLDVRPPVLLFFLPRRSGFYWFKRNLVGGAYYTLSGLQNAVIFSRFDDARIHFALAHGTLGGGRPAQRAFTGATLEADLDGQARSFVADERNVRIDLQERRVYLSRIFDWYEDDFLRNQRQNDRPAQLSAYIADLLEPEKAALLQACSGCRIEYVDFDWSLNEIPPEPETPPEP